MYVRCTPLRLLRCHGYGGSALELHNGVFAVSSVFIVRSFNSGVFLSASSHTLNTFQFETSSPVQAVWAERPLPRAHGGLMVLV